MFSHMWNLFLKIERQKILQWILHSEDENKTTKGQEVSNLRRRTDKYSESNIEAAVHTQIL
jgi:hypothetical protein